LTRKSSHGEPHPERAQIALRGAKESGPKTLPKHKNLGGNQGVTNCSSISRSQTGKDYHKGSIPNMGNQHKYGIKK